MIRLSIPGNECVHCGTVMGEALTCSGCGWVDPLTRSAPGWAICSDCYWEGARTCLDEPKCWHPMKTEDLQ